MRAFYSKEWFRILCFVVLVCPGFPEPGLCFAYTPSADSVVVAAGKRYEQAGALGHFFMGANYRREWAMTVKMPVLDVRTVRGGLRPTELGGGKQTKSLRLEEADATEWVLRTVDKDITLVLPRFLQKTFAKRLAQDIVSAAHPYAPLVVSRLADAAGVTEARPYLYYVPSNNGLGEYSKIFADKVCMLEKRHPVRRGTDPESMNDVLKALQKNNKKLVLQKEVLRARLLDMLVADWDRHADQWRWGSYDSSGRTYFYPIPVDRDQAFFRSKGVLVMLARVTAAPFFSGYRKNINGLHRLNKVGEKFDRVFFNELSKEDWQQTIIDVQQRLTDSVIDEAFMRMPPEVYAIRGPEMAETMKARRDHLMKAGMKYYRFLAKNVYITSTNDKELYRLRTKNGQTTLTIYNCAEPKDECEIYRRSFDKKDTKKLYFVGLQKQDQFMTDEDSETNFKFDKLEPDEQGPYDLVEKMKVKLEKR